MHTGGNIKYDFLDTNVMLSIPLQDEKKTICENYFNENSVKYISKTVKNESKSVINKLNKFTILILEYIQNYAIENNISDSMIYKHMKKIKKEFKNKYSSTKYPLNFTRKRFDKLVNQLFNYYTSLIKKILLFPLLN